MNIKEWLAREVVHNVSDRTTSDYISAVGHALVLYETLRRKWPEITPQTEVTQEQMPFAVDRIVLVLEPQRLDFSRLEITVDPQINSQLAEIGYHNNKLWVNV